MPPRMPRALSDDGHQSHKGLFSLCCSWPLWLLLSAISVAPAGGQTLRQRMLVAEDARDVAAVAPLLEGLRSADSSLVAHAARGLGRFERPELIQHLTPLLTSVRAEVRREAVNAIGQSLATASRESPERSELQPATRRLLALLRTEPDLATRGVVAETLGRLPLRSAAAVSEVEQALQVQLASQDRPQPELLRGIFRGLDFLIRGNAKIRSQDERTPLLVRRRIERPSDADTPLVRRAAWLVVLSAGTGDASLVTAGLDDSDWQVRRLATAALGGQQIADPDKRRLLTRAMADASANVRLQAVAVYGRTLQARDCSPTLQAVADQDLHVSLSAIDALVSGCAEGPSPVATLARIVDSLPRSATGQWHRPAHALIALAAVAREAAASRLATFAEHPRWEVRMYAARAAGALAARSRLERLANDDNDNVRGAAIAGLRLASGHDADAIYIAALARRDYQLVMTAAAALEGSPRAVNAVPALLAAFTRITAEGRDTSRDARMALLTRVRELGSPASGSALQPCVRDFDPVVARECAAILRQWGMTPPAPQPPPRRANRPPSQPLPTAARIVMRDGGVMEVRLDPDEAPLTVERFAALVRKGYYNGLTFHRVVPNFVLQGGSPGGNEYSGDGPFMRDELGLRTNARGTLGTSTRGRDTGDAQFFVNLVDNPRLDHEFTVFGEIVEGLDVMDRVAEGDVIARIEMR